MDFPQTGSLFSSPFGCTFLKPDEPFGGSPRGPIFRYSRIVSLRGNSRCGEEGWHSKEHLLKYTDEIFNKDQWGAETLPKIMTVREASDYLRIHPTDHGISPTALKADPRLSRRFRNGALAARPSTAGALERSGR
jgi:hypothetical protein